MKARCYNPNHIGYPNYGGRGITICPEWLESFQAFHNYVGDPPRGYTINRIDDGNYEPGNVNWETKKKQQHKQKMFSLNDLHHVPVYAVFVCSTMPFHVLKQTAL